MLEAKNNYKTLKCFQMHMGVSALIRVAHFNEYLKKQEFAHHDDVVIVEGDGLEIHEFYSHKILMHISSH